MFFKKNLIFLLSLLLALSVAGCLRGRDESEGNTQRQTPMPREIDKIESTLLLIMQQADLIPMVEQISLQGQEADREKEPIFDETILGEVLNREAETEPGDGEDNKELPEDTEEIWDDIKTKLTELHNQWDELEPVLVQENISENVIANFENELDNLTVFSTAMDQSGTLTAANQMTLHLSKFRVPFAKSSEPLAYELRYYVRSIVLDAGGGNFAAAQAGLAYIKEQQPALTKTIAKETAAELYTSLGNLQRALDKEDLNLVKVNAAEVMENIVQITKRLQS